MEPDFDALTLDALAERRSAKWRVHPPDVLPVWVAELDVPLAPAVRTALLAAVERGDTGYASPVDLARSFTGFARRSWEWDVEPDDCWPVADVMIGVGEALKVLTAPGDGVVICPPVYHPFFTVPEEVGRRGVQVPLRPDGALDLPGIAAALDGSARAVLLCNPHNPTGRVWTPAELAALDDVARAADAVVISDEIHAPLTLPGAQFTPYLRYGDREAVAVVSASKAFNLAGLKAALVVAGSERTHARMATTPPELAYRAGHLGVLASTAAYDEGDEWLAGLLSHLDRNRALVATLLRDQLPEIDYVPPQASYLAWLDCRSMGPEPAALMIEHGRVALVEGTQFGAASAGWARLNFGTTRSIVEEAVQRMALAHKEIGLGSTR